MMDEAVIEKLIAANTMVRNKAKCRKTLELWKEIGKNPNLLSTKEQKLVKEANEQLHQVYEQFKNMAYWIANRLCNARSCRYLIQDCESVALEYLVQAARMYTQKETSFSTYVYVVMKRGVNRFLSDQIKMKFEDTDSGKYLRNGKVYQETPPNTQEIIELIEHEFDRKKPAENLQYAALMAVISDIPLAEVARNWNPPVTRAGVWEALQHAKRKVEKALRRCAA